MIEIVNRPPSYHSSAKYAAIIDALLTIGEGQALKVPVDTFGGVTLHRASGLWHAQVKVDQRNTSLGYFHDRALAGDAVQSFLRKAGVGR